LTRHISAFIIFQLGQYKLESGTAEQNVKFAFEVNEIRNRTTLFLAGMSNHRMFWHLVSFPTHSCSSGAYLRTALLGLFYFIMTIQPSTL